MKRSAWVTGATVLQTLQGFFLAGLSVFLLSLVRLPEIKQGKDAAETLAGIKIAAGMIAAPAIPVLASAYGMWKHRLWGWWMALVTDMGLFIAFVYSMVDDGWSNVDWELVIFAALALFAVLMLLLPSVRSFYWRSGDSALPSAAVGRPSL